MRKRLTKFTLEQVAPKDGKRVEIRDADSPLVFRLTPAGERSFCVRTRLNGAQVRLKYPRPCTVENLPDARQWAVAAVADCKAGNNPRATVEAAEKKAAQAAERAERIRFEAVVRQYIERRVKREKKNRTAEDTERLFALYVTPRWKDRPITDIRRLDVNELLDDIFDGKIERGGETFGGHVVADRVLAQIRALFNWYARQDGDFTSPIVTGMARTNPRDRARKRILSDEEIRVMWPLLADEGVFGAIVKTLLLSAQRRDEVGLMARSEFEGERVWTIPGERYKTKLPNVVPLSVAAWAVVDAQPIIDDCDFVFSINGKNRFNGFSKSKARLDKKMLAALREAAAKRGEDAAKVILADWRLHDLRRTAKTLMARAKVRPDISERVLGHIIPGVEGTYDRYDYLAEKRDALEKLAAMVDSIVRLRPAAFSIAAE